MKILMVSSEFAPHARTGGLGDMVAALSRELAQMGHEVVVFAPRYRQFAETMADAQLVCADLKVPLGPREVRGKLHVARIEDRLHLALVGQGDFYDRRELYGEGGQGYSDNAERFLFLSKAVAAGAAAMGFEPDVLHAHDWHTAFAPLWWVYTRGLGRTRTVFTIHNAWYQGCFPGWQFELTNLPGQYFGIYGLEYYGELCLMKAGVLFSHAVTTLSPRYAKEIQTRDFGHGLEGLLQSQRQKLRGVLNGVDYAEWNPETDPHIAARYSASDLAGKAVCKRALLAAFDLPLERASAPLIGMVSRIDHQKGHDIVAEAIPAIMEMGATLVILGTGEPGLAGWLGHLAARHQTQMGLRVVFDTPLAHRIQAGADILLMPSRCEPCGVGQMCALRYGTVPVVHDTGGLADTVVAYDPAKRTGTGFKFSPLRADIMLDALRQAVALHRQPRQWQRLMRNGMARDFSWRKSASEYVRLYEGNCLLPTPRRPCSMKKENS